MFTTLTMLSPSSCFVTLFFFCCFHAVGLPGQSPAVGRGSCGARSERHTGPDEGVRLRSLLLTLILTLLLQQKCSIFYLLSVRPPVVQLQASSTQTQTCSAPVVEPGPFLVTQRQPIMNVSHLTLNDSSSHNGSCYVNCLHATQSPHNPAGVRCSAWFGANAAWTYRCDLTQPHYLFECFVICCHTHTINGYFHTTC